MIPRTTDDITDDPEELRHSIYLLYIAGSLVILLITVNVYTTWLIGPQPLSYAIAAVGLIAFIGIIWRGYLAWRKLQ